MADAYDEEFQRYVRLAQQMISKLHDANDVLICKKWISKLHNLTSDDVTVKKNRNHFFKYLLHVLHDGVLEGPFQPLPDEELHEGTECLCSGDKPKDVQDARERIKEQAPYMSQWSKDKRTYVAAKSLPGHGALIYMAVSKDPKLGWDVPNI